jgi:hypothetical protein
VSISEQAQEALNTAPPLDQVQQSEPLTAFPAVLDFLAGCVLHRVPKHFLLAA